MSTTLEYERIEGGTEFSPPCRFVRLKGSGVVLLDFFPPFAAPIKQLDIRDDDVFVCGFQKTGTRWTQEMVWCIANSLDDKGAHVFLDRRFPLLEFSGFNGEKLIMEKYPDMPISDQLLDSVKFVDELKSPRFIKSHLPFHLLPDKLTNFSTKAKIIYVCRNPKDTCVSYYHFIKPFQEINFDTFCNLFLDDTLPNCPFWDHILKFWKQRNHPNILFLRYEDMKKDLPSIIKKTALFLGKALSDEQISRLVDHLSIESMRNNRAFNFLSVYEFGRKFNIIKEDCRFIRSGSVGGWRSEMTPELIERFDSWTNEKIADTGFQLIDNLPDATPAKK